MAESAELLPGTLDLLILKAVSLGDLHGYAVLLRIEQIEGARQELSGFSHRFPLRRLGKG